MIKVYKNGLGADVSVHILYIITFTKYNTKYNADSFYSCLAFYYVYLIHIFVTGLYYINWIVRVGVILRNEKINNSLGQLN